MVIPVYQCAYSWDEEQCQQLWDDVVATGRRGEGTHFTGSVVMVLDGTPDFSGMSRVLVIDGQQRITTLTLLLVALAEFARDNPDKVSHFSFEEVMGSGPSRLALQEGSRPLPPHALAGRRDHAAFRHRPS